MTAGVDERGTPVTSSMTSTAEREAGGGGVAVIVGVSVAGAALLVTAVGLLVVLGCRVSRRHARHADNNVDTRQHVTCTDHRQHSGLSVCLSHHRQHSGRHRLTVCLSVCLTTNNTQVVTRFTLSASVSLPSHIQSDSRHFSHVHCYKSC